MKRPPIEQIRRLVLAALVVVVLIVAGNYALRRWRAHQARQAVPASVPGDIRQQAERFTFSRSEGGQTLFTVEAQRTTERAGQTMVLEDVLVRIYGGRGERADEIRTARCEYDVGGTEEIICSGEVTVLVRNAPAPPSAGQTSPTGPERSIRLTTSGVHFDPKQGVAWTDQPVQFAFPQGSGEALGLRYQPVEPSVVLEKQVVIHVSAGGGGIAIRGAQLRFYSRERAFDLVPPLELRVENELLTAEQLRMELDAGFNSERIVATGNVRARGQAWGRPVTARAAQAVAEYSGGHIERLRATGGVVFEQESQGSKELLTSNEAVFNFDPGRRQVERLTATGAARLVSTAAEQTRELRGPQMEMRPRGNTQLLAARPGSTLLLRSAGGEEQTITAEEIELQFEQRQWLRGLAASGDVRTRRVRPGATPSTTASQNLRARFDARGRLVEAEQWGQFRYQDDAWQAEAGRATYVAASGLYRLREQPVFWDATTRTKARAIDLEERTGALRAEGEVRTTYQSSAVEKPGFGSGEPSHLAAERLVAERGSGRARYQGRARLWQGENRLEADAIELHRSPKRLVAMGNVSGLFSEATSAGGRRRPVQVTSDLLTFFEAEHRGIFEGGVRAHNDFGTLRAPQLDVFLSRSGDASAGQLERALARGGVVIEQDGAQAMGEQAEYSAAAQTVAVWGGAPRLVDPARGTTAGDRLTLFLADGTIRVDSAEGTRTVTRRPWTR